MGYTHYWTKRTDLSDTQWNTLTQAATKIIMQAQLDGIGLAWESDEDKAPEISENLIRFNGIGDDGHETFYLTRHQEGFAFCKTVQKPYDVVVVAILIAAETLAAPRFSWTSDGEPEEHADGAELLKRATGLLRRATMAEVIDLDEVRNGH